MIVCRGLHGVIALALFALGAHAQDCQLTGVAPIPFGLSPAQCGILQGFNQAGQAAIVFPGATKECDNSDGDCCDNGDPTWLPAGPNWSIGYRTESGYVLQDLTADERSAIERYSSILMEQGINLYGMPPKELLSGSPAGSDFQSYLSYLKDKHSDALGPGSHSDIAALIFAGRVER